MTMYEEAMAAYHASIVGGGMIAGWTFNDAFDDVGEVQRCKLQIGAPDDPTVCYECGAKLGEGHPAPATP